MATLVRARVDDLDRNIPSPFPVHLLHDHLHDELAAEPVDHAPTDILSSIAAVQHSCLITLANILSLSSPIGPSTGAAIPLHQFLSETPLSCLIHALRAQDGHRDQRDLPLGEAAQLAQLRELIDSVAPSLGPPDAYLAQAIVTLLFDLEQLPASLALSSPVSQPVPSQGNDSAIAPASASPYDTIASLQRQLSSLQPSSHTSSGSRTTPAESVRTALLWTRIDEQLDTVVSLCRARASSASQHGVSQIPSVQSCASHDGNQDFRRSFDTLPPEYDSEYHYSYELPPSYAPEAHPSTSSMEEPSDEKRPAVQYPPEKVLPRTSASVSAVRAELIMEPPTSSSSNSLDFEGITHAIERLYVVAPQLGDQRVELRSEKIAQMERAKAGKGKARTRVDPADAELDKILDLLGKASTREIPDQSVIMDPRRSGREKGAADIEEQRRKYLEHLVNRTYAGRLHSQDAMPSLSRAYSSPSSAGGAVRDAEEGPSSEVQPGGRGSRDGKRASCPAVPKSGSTLELPLEKLRDRSLSAPHLAWLRPKDRSGNANGTKENSSSVTRSVSSDPKGLSSLAASKSVRSFPGKLYGTKSRPPSADAEDINEDVSNGALNIAYVAEHHETLKHVLLFIAHASPSSLTSNGVPLAEVLPSTSSGTYGDCLFLRLSGTPSPPLALPVPVVPGSKVVLSRSGHWEIKANCYQGGAPPKENEEVALLPASELASLSPSSYICSSCSLPLVPAPPARYRDLPSEHWEELIEAWICHPEGQTLAKIGTHGSNGSFEFWPTREEALVGGSYVLFDGEAVARGNIKCVGVRERGGNTRLARCLCGATLGRQHDRKQEAGSVSRMYRLFKYAIRPASATSQVPKIPMSAFVLHDMLEHVRAHATYRFVLSDDEDERPRLLIWLFKPRLRISYMLPTSALLPKNGTIDTSKVLYKIIGPASVTSDFKDIVSKYPGFPQAEHLFYPMDVCRKLAALLKESTASYPVGMRTMTGLDVGWLATA